MPELQRLALCWLCLQVVRRAWSSRWSGRSCSWFHCCSLVMDGVGMLAPSCWWPAKGKKKLLKGRRERKDWPPSFMALVHQSFRLLAGAWFWCGVHWSSKERGKGMRVSGGDDDLVRWGRQGLFCGCSSAVSWLFGEESGEVSRHGVFGFSGKCSVRMVAGKYKNLKILKTKTIWKFSLNFIYHPHWPNN